MSKTYIFLPLLLLLFGCSATKKSTSSKNSVSFKELSHGIYKVNSVKEMSKESPSGLHGVIHGYDLIKKCDTIPGELGISFGTSYMIQSRLESEEIMREWLLPSEMTNFKGEKFKKLKLKYSASTNDNLITTYSFEHNFEILRGTWVLNMYYKKKLIYTQSFIVK